VKPAVDALYEFGPFRADPRERLLLRGGDVVPLAPKLFDMLLLLLDRAGQLVTREELTRELWPDTFVDEGAPAKNLWLLRKALEDAGGSPADIQTIPRVGYRFTGAVRRTARKRADASVSSRARPFEFRLSWAGKNARLQDGAWVLGRDPEADVFIDMSNVSRHHARVLVDGEKVTIEDLGSKNGTFVRGVRIETPTPLSDGDEIHLGSVRFLFRAAGGPASTRTHQSRSR
jgi:DNA-binding winged helix-turn-helix (wHTH) protein/cold shock CspA family protein